MTNQKMIVCAACGGDEMHERKTSCIVTGEEGADIKWVNLEKCITCGEWNVGNEVSERDRS